MQGRYVCWPCRPTSYFSSPCTARCPGGDAYGPCHARGWRGFVHTLKTFVQQEEAGSAPGTPAVFVNGYYVGDGTREQICAQARQLPTPPVRTQATDADIRESLYGALAREMAVDFTPIFIDAVDVANQTFTYRQGERLMQRSWRVEDGQIMLTDGAQDVQRSTTYTPVTQAQQEDPPMATEAVKARVNALLVSDPRWKETDRTQLETMSEAQLALVEANAADQARLQQYDTRKQATITALVAAQYPLSADRLNALNLDELEKLVPLTIAQDPSYAGQGFPALRSQADGEESWLPKSILAKKE